MLEVYFFYPFSTLARSNSSHFEALRVWKIMQLFKISFTSGDFKSGMNSFNRSTQIDLRQCKLVSNDSFTVFLHQKRALSDINNHIFKTKWVTPIYFCISDTSNSLAISRRSFIKLSMLEDYRANVLKSHHHNVFLFILL